jgi:hypothetical protein
LFFSHFIFHLGFRPSYAFPLFNCKFPCCLSLTKSDLRCRHNCSYADLYRPLTGDSSM